MTAQVLATERTQPAVDCVAFIGSHPRATDRTQEIRDVCPVERDVLLIYTMTQTGSYSVSSILNFVIAARPSLVYFSDHGLAFKERGKAVQYTAR